MRTKKRIRLKGRLRIYMQTSLYMGILLLIVDIGTYFLDVRAGFLLTCFLLFYFGMIILLMFYNRPIILNELISFATQYGQVQKTLLRDMAIPYALLDETGRVIWCNDAFRAAIHSEKGFHKSITCLLYTSFSGEAPTLVVYNQDKPGCIVKVTSRLGEAGINIATMQVYRDERGGHAVMVIEVDQEVPRERIAALEQEEGIEKVIYLCLEE